MEYSFMFKGFGAVLSGITKKALNDKKVNSQIKKSYKEIVLRAKDIGKSNNLLSSYALAAYFIAMNREDGLSAEENYKILDNGLRNSKLLKAFMGDSKGYFSEKHMEFRRKWSKLTNSEENRKKYPNDWVVDVVEGNGDFVFGFDYRECGVCKLCRDENCFELAKYLCKLDFMLVEIIGIKLKRTGTLADGCDKCDFRFYN